MIEKVNINNLLILIMSSYLVAIGCNKKQDDFILPTHADIIRRANVIYDSAEFQTGYMHIPPYIANGVIGGCFDHMGFQSRPDKGIPNGRTVIGYADHYYMHPSTTRQAQLPLAYIEAGFADGYPVLNMMDATNYRQELDIYTGVLTTSYDLFGKTSITAMSHQLYPGLFVMKIDRKTDVTGKELVVKINCNTAETQKNMNWAPEAQKFQYEVTNYSVQIISSTNMVDTRWSVLCNQPISLKENRLSIQCGEGETLIKIIVRRDDTRFETLQQQPFDSLLRSHKTKWKSLWERSWISFPEDRAHCIWNRANYYNLSNFPVVPEKALIPTGMNSNIWGFTFPQDVYYVAENLLRSGHFDRYRKSMKYWLEILPEVKKYSKRIMDVEGGFYPWTPPFDQWDEFEKNGVVGNDSYEIHNPAYVAAMVWHYYLRSNDTVFLREYFPIMEEVWRFYSQLLHENEKGTFDINHHKSAGQDEASRLDSSKNLLCASYSAEYTARNYVKACGLVNTTEKLLLEKARKVIDAGLERSALLKSEGFYATYEGDIRPPNSQKHPVQLNAITFVPMSDLGTDKPSVMAWQNRYNLTAEAKKPVSHGWTFAAFSLASSRLGNPGGLASDLSAAQYCAHADPRWIQFYEFTFWERYTLNTAYYFPTHGLYQQALTDALVQDWQGYVELFACMMEEWKTQKISFKGLYSLGGVSVDGHWDNGKFSVIIHPNGAGSVQLKISTVTGTIQISGDKNEIRLCKAGEKILLDFLDNQSIQLFN